MSTYSPITDPYHSPLANILVYALSLSFNIRHRLILLFNQHGHFVKHLSELGEGFLNLLNLDMTFLDFTESTAGGAVSVGIEQLYPVSL